jgi:hypothetical protein
VLILYEDVFGLSLDRLLGQIAGILHEFGRHRVKFVHAQILHVLHCKWRDLISVSSGNSVVLIEIRNVF